MEPLAVRAEIKPSRGRLTRDAIVQAAINIIDAEDISGFSTRKLGKSLGVEAMALYHHFKNREEILAAVAEEITAEIIGIEVDYQDKSWQDQIKISARNALNVMRSHKGALSLMLEHGKISAPWMIWHERQLAILLKAGLPPKEAIAAFRAISGYIFGFTGFEMRFRPIMEKKDFVNLMIEEFKQSDYNSLKSTTEYFRRDWDDQFEAGLDLLIAGIAAQIESFNKV